LKDANLYRVDIVGNNNQLSTVALDERGNVVDTRDDRDGTFDSVQALTLGLGFSKLGDALLPLERGLWAVLVEQSEQLNGCVYN
jgi:hypothetical protein